MPALARMRRHRGPAQVDALPLTEQFGEVGVVGALVAAGGQFHHGVRLGRRDSIVGTAATVTVGQRGGAILAISRQQPASMSRGHPQHLGGLGDGNLVFQNGVQHGKSGLFFLVQRNVLHKMDIFAEQLMDDRIVEQQQITGSMSAAFHTQLSGQGEVPLDGEEVLHYAVGWCEEDGVAGFHQAMSQGAERMGLAGAGQSEGQHVDAVLHETALGQLVHLGPAAPGGARRSSRSCPRGTWTPDATG